METKLSFEQALEKLENIVKQLELGEISLEESIRIYQQGITLSNFCSKKLEEAEGKVMTIMSNDGNNMEEFNISK